MSKYTYNDRINVVKEELQAIKDYYGMKESSLSNKLSLLEKRKERFDQLMGMSDEQLRIQNSNERVLATSKEYQNPESPESLKQAIRYRKFGDYTKNEHQDSVDSFLSDFKQHGYGLTFTDPSVESVQEQVQTTALEKSLDQVMARFKGLGMESRKILQSLMTVGFSPSNIEFLLERTYIKEPGAGIRTKSLVDSLYSIFGESGLANATSGPLTYNHFLNFVQDAVALREELKREGFSISHNDAFSFLQTYGDSDSVMGVIDDVDNSDFIEELNDEEE